LVFDRDCEGDRGRFDAPGCEKAFAGDPAAMDSALILQAPNAQRLVLIGGQSLKRFFE